MLLMETSVRHAVAQLMTVKQSPCPESSILHRCVKQHASRRWLNGVVQSDGMSHQSCNEDSDLLHSVQSSDVVQCVQRRRQTTM